MWYILENSEKQEICERDVRPNFQDGDTFWTRLSPGYSSYEDLIEKNKILDEPCVCCGRKTITTYHNRDSLVKKNMCFGCDIWDERSKHQNNDNVMIVNGDWYTVGPEDKNNKMRGFGGRKFVFVKNGKMVESTNVWFGGEIPQIWKSKIKDNASII